MIETLAEPQGEEVIPTQELNRGDWRGEVTGTDSDHVEDAADLSDGSDASRDRLLCQWHRLSVYADGGSGHFTDLPVVLHFRNGRAMPMCSGASMAGIAGKYRLQVSEDGTEWIDAGSGEFTREDYNLHEIDGIYNIGDLVYGSFDQEYTARYVRLISDSGALSDEKTLQWRREFRLYADPYVGQTMPADDDQLCSNLTLPEDAQASDTETGGKQEHAGSDDRSSGEACAG